VAVGQDGEVVTFARISMGGFARISVGCWFARISAVCWFARISAVCWFGKISVVCFVGNSRVYFDRVTYRRRRDFLLGRLGFETSCLASICGDSIIKVDWSCLRVLVSCFLQDMESELPTNTSRTYRNKEHFRCTD
jgi:hypothetical protein